jgi:D-glycero-D-manno-heptose 1,7-bisphosphate phosphatase
VIRLTRRLEDNAVAAMFLDRDGVINVKAPPGQYVTSPDDLILIDGAAAAIRRVNELRIPVYIVTNQRWVAHRSDGIPKLRAIHSRLEALLASAGAFVDGIYACGHEINQCECRKPQRGLVDQVLRDNPSLRLSSCALVGDSETDIEVAARCGMYSVRLCSGHGSEPGRTGACETAEDLYSAVVGRRPARTTAGYSVPREPCVATPTGSPPSASMPSSASDSGGLRQRKPEAYP